MRWEKCGEEWAEQMKPHEGSNMVAAGLGHRRLWLLMKPGSLVFIREVAADRSSSRSSDPHRSRLCSHSGMMMMNLNTHLQGGSWGLLYCFIYNQICPNILEKVFLLTWSWESALSHPESFVLNLSRLLQTKAASLSRPLRAFMSRRGVTRSVCASWEHFGKLPAYEGGFWMQRLCVHVYTWGLARWGTDRQMVALIG